MSTDTSLKYPLPELTDPSLFWEVEFNHAVPGVSGYNMVVRLRKVVGDNRYCTLKEVHSALWLDSPSEGVAVRVSALAERVWKDHLKPTSEAARLSAHVEAVHELTGIEVVVTEV